MNATLILDWSEVWAPLIPLYIYFTKRPQGNNLQLVAVYLAAAFVLNCIIDISWKYNSAMPVYLRNNNFLYNLSSLLRIVFFTFFFAHIIAPPLKNYVPGILIFFLLLFCGYFFINHNFRFFNSYLHSAEGIWLLLLSIYYFFQIIFSDEVFVHFNPALFITSGLALYESVNIFAFLFYQYLIVHNPIFAHYLWNVPNFFFIVLCIFIARAFYNGKKKTAL